MTCICYGFNARTMGLGERGIVYKKRHEGFLALHMGNRISGFGHIYIYIYMHIYIYAYILKKKKKKNVDIWASPSHPTRARTLRSTGEGKCLWHARRPRLLKPTEGPAFSHRGKRAASKWALFFSGCVGMWWLREAKRKPSSLG